MRDTSPLLRAGIHGLATSAASVAVSLVTSIVIARVAGPAGKGGFDLALATAALLGLLLGFSLAAGVTFSVARGAVSVPSLLPRLGATVVVQGVAAALLLTAAQASSISPALLPRGLERDVIIPVTLLVMLSILAGYLRAILVGRQHFVAANWRDILSRVLLLSLILVVAAIRLQAGHQVTSVDLIWVATLSGVLPVVLFLSHVIRHSSKEDVSGRVDMRELVRYSSRAYIGNVIQFFNYRLDLFLIGLLLGIQSVGLYALSASLAQLLWLVSSTAAGILLPRVAAAASPSEAALQTAYVARLVLVGSVLAASALGILVVSFVPVLYGAEFGAAVLPTLVLLPGAALFAVAAVLAAYLGGIGKPGWNAWIAAAGLATTVPLDLVLIPNLGVIGASLASTASYCATFALTLVAFSRQSRVSVASAIVPRRADLLRVIAALWGGRTHRSQFP